MSRRGIGVCPICGRTLTISVGGLMLRHNGREVTRDGQGVLCNGQGREALPPGRGVSGAS